jgi:hypothetical protein
LVKFGFELRENDIKRQFIQLGNFWKRGRNLNYIEEPKLEIAN